VEELLRRVIGDRMAVVVATERIDGDVHPKRIGASLLKARQSAITEQTWTMLDQLHGVRCHSCETAARTPGVVARGDILVTSETGVPLAVWAADCAPVVLIGLDGTTVALHAGWRGLAAGVIDAGIAEMDARGDRTALAVLGPAIHPCCYEFSEPDLRLVSAGCGTSREAISGRTRNGRLALDVPAAVREALARHGLELEVTAGCTGCDDRWFSHRVRGDVARHAVVAWTESIPCGMLGKNGG
jgi:copper oxidase (laccase) domain-containing protein